MNTEKNIVALGFFDGVHLGHQALLAQCVALARKTGAAPAAITFEDHPMAAFTSEYPPLLSSLHDRCRLLLQYGMECVWPQPVTKEVMSTSWEAFLEGLLQRGAVGFVCGDDFRFGTGGAGNAALLREFCAQRGLPCVIVPEQTLDGIRISSSHIRRLLEAGDLAQAERFLGHPYSFTGIVIHGQALGRTLGIPTANLDVPQKLLLPPRGVYACRAQALGQTFAAVTNIGIRPTVSGEGLTVEPWLLDFQGDLYGRLLTLEFVQFLRPERKFASLEELTAEIHCNAAQTREILKIFS